MITIHMHPSLLLEWAALLIGRTKCSPPASERASTSLSLCQPLGQSGNTRPPCLTTSGGDSETPNQRLPPLSHPHSAPLLSSLLPPPHPPPSPSLPPPQCLQPPNLWTWTTPTQ